MTIKDVIKKYKKGELTNETDEKYAGGFWDLAFEITSSDKMSLGYKGLKSLLKTAETIRDLSDETKITTNHIAEALQYRDKTI